MRQQPARIYGFGPFVLDTAQHLLSREGEAVPLTKKPYEILLLLIENRERMLTKDELMKTLWPESIVEESNLTQQISMIRRALGETAGDHRYIVTVPGRGYRFAADVQETQPIEPPLPRSSRHQISLPLVALGVLGLLAASFVVYRTQSAKVLRGARTLAILPFQSLRKDPQSDFLGFSLADAAITKLDFVSSLRVRPSSAIEKYRNQTIDVPRVAGELHVNTLLMGNFLREGDILRITCQLIDIPTQNLLWKSAFDLKYDQLLTVQDRVAQEIIKGLKLSLSPVEAEQMKPDRAIDPIAYEYYLRGVDLYSRNEFPFAIKMLEQSAQIDPAYALTWAHLGRAHTANASFELGGREEYRAAQAAYEKALALRPSLIEAQIYMANRFTDTGKAENAVPLLREALRTNPNHAEVHWELGYAYRFGGMLRESVAECERARELDPGVKLSTSALNGYLYLAQYDKFLDSLPDGNDSGLIVFYRGLGNYYKKSWMPAAQYFDDAFDKHPSLLQARVGKALSYAVRHQNPKGLDILRQTENAIAERGVGDPEAIFKIAQAYAVLGDRIAALRVLRLSIETGFFSYPYLAADPLLDTLRDQSEFRSLMTLAQQRHEAFKKKFF